MPVTPLLETETVSRLSREVASLSAEILTLNDQLSSALHGVCNSGDMGSEGLLLLLERKLQGYKLVRAQDYALYTAWLSSPKFQEGIESMEWEASQGESDLLEAYGAVFDPSI